MILFYDDWSRANGDVGANYIQALGAGGGVRRPSIVSNRVENTLSLSSFVQVLYGGLGGSGVFANDQFATFRVHALANSSCIIAIFLRASSTVGTVYRFYLVGPLGGAVSINIAKSVAGSFVALVNTTVAVAADDEFYASVSSSGPNILDCGINGVSKLSTTDTDASLVSGLPGFNLTVDATAANCIGGPFACGDFMPMPMQMY